MKNYIQILDAGFQEIQVGVIPATVDQVMVGISPEASGGSEGTVFCGVNEGTVPQRKSGASLLSDRDRAALKNGYRAGSHSEEDGCIQKFYLYLMMSKPSGQLVITYAGLTSDGKSQRTLQSHGRSGKAVSGNGNPGRAFRGVAGADREGCQGAAYTGLRGMQEQGEDDREREEAAFMQLFQHFLYIAGAPG